MKVSIIIPHLNQPQMLDRCLTSLQRQVDALKGTEVIVVDNGSQRQPLDICNRFKFVRLEREMVPGPGMARNRGISLASGEVLAFIDADCIAEENWLASVTSIFSDHETVKVIGGDVRIAYDDPNKLTALEAYESVFAFRQKEYIEKHHFSGTGNLAMRREIFAAVGPFAGIGVAEDRDWGRRAFDHGILVTYVKDMIVYHPARNSFSELAHKWDRHISHDFNDRKNSWPSKLKWIALAMAIAVSGVIDIRKIFTSTRLHGINNRMRAAIVLLRIRLYRAMLMVSLVLRKAGTVDPKWNQR
jgi:glycosyltransferase involved in cell wall biosynthesis